MSIEKFCKSEIKRKNYDKSVNEQKQFVLIFKSKFKFKFNLCNYF